MKEHFVRLPAFVTVMALGLMLLGGCRGCVKRAAKRSSGEAASDYIERRSVHETKRARGTRGPSSRGAPDVHVGELRRSQNVDVPTGGDVIFVQERRHTKSLDPLEAADELAKAGNVKGAASVYAEVVANTPPFTTLDRARVAVVHAAERRPDAVLEELSHVTANSGWLLPDAEELLFRATAEVGTASAAEHVKHALRHGLPLANDRGKLICELDMILLVRDVEELQTVAKRIPPATDLAERAIYLDNRLRLGEAGVLPDLGGQAARWQAHPHVRMSELRRQPAGPLADRLGEKSTDSKFIYIPPRVLAKAGRVHSPIVIRYERCESDWRTNEPSDDC